MTAPTRTPANQLRWRDLSATVATASGFDNAMPHTADTRVPHQAMLMKSVELTLTSPVGNKTAASDVTNIGEGLTSNQG